MRWHLRSCLKKPVIAREGQLIAGQVLVHRIGRLARWGNTHEASQLLSNAEDHIQVELIQRITQASVLILRMLAQFSGVDSVPERIDRWAIAILPESDAAL